MRSTTGGRRDVEKDLRRSSSSSVDSVLDYLVDRSYGSPDRLLDARDLLGAWLGGVGDLGQVDEDEGVAEGVADGGGSSHGDIERCGDEVAAMTGQKLDGFVDAVDQPVRLVALVGCQHQLAVPVGQRQSGLADRVVAPDEPVAQCLAVIAQTCIEVRHRHGHRVTPPPVAMY